MDASCSIMTVRNKLPEKLLEKLSHRLLERRVNEFDSIFRMSKSKDDM